MNFGKMFVHTKVNPIAEADLRGAPKGRTLPRWLKILPVIVVQGIVRHTNWVRPLNGTYSMPFHDVLMERDIKHNAP